MRLRTVNPNGHPVGCSTVCSAHDERKSSTRCCTTAMNSSVGSACTSIGMPARGASASTATPGVAEIAVSTATEYSPGEKTSSGTSAAGSVSAPSIDTWRLSTSKPLTEKRIDPCTDRSITASGLRANRQRGSRLDPPSRCTDSVVVPAYPPAVYDTVRRVTSPSTDSSTIAASINGVSASGLSSASDAVAGRPAASRSAESTATPGTASASAARRSCSSSR